MKIIHINSYYISRLLHSFLISEIDKNADFQIVYIPISKFKYNGKYSLKNLSNSIYIYSRCFLPFMRYIWPLKIFLIWKDFQKKVIIRSEKEFVVHAHSLMVNGIIAYLINKKYGNKYLVTIRNTDLNIFIKKSVLFKLLGYEILKNASSIILLSPAYLRETIPNIFGEKKFNSIKSKIQIIPNGVDDFWQEHRNIHKKHGNPLVLLFVGELNKNKNILTLIESFKLLNKQGVSCILNIVGDGPMLDSLKKIALNQNINIFGKIDDKNLLIEIYSKSDILIVPSILESFGLVYVEAMTQGLPVIYTSNQGFDGFFEEGHVGYSVDPLNIEEIASKIKRIVENYDTISSNAYNESEKFSWGNSTQKLMELYSNLQ